MFNPFSAAVTAAGFAVNAGSKVIQIVGKRSSKAKLRPKPYQEDQSDFNSLFYLRHKFTSSSSGRKRL